MSYSTIAVANYFIKKSSKAHIKLSKNKLMQIVMYAHIKYILNYDRALLAEKLNLMHFGFVLKSFEKYFAFLNAYEPITKVSYTKCEHYSRILMREHSLEIECDDTEKYKKLCDFLDKIFEKFKLLSDPASVNLNIKPGSIWHELAFNKYKGCHLIRDYTEISNKLLLTLGSVGQAIIK